MEDIKNIENEEINKKTNLELMKFNNELNTISLVGLEAKEIDLFFAICLKLSKSGSNSVKISYEEALKLCDYKVRDKKRQENFIKNMIGKLIRINIEAITPGVLYTVMIFSDFEQHKETKEIVVNMNDKYLFLFNKVISNFTIISLHEMISLNSAYAKTAYRIFKQWEDTGWCEIIKENLFYYFDIPKSYPPAEVKRRVIAIILKELAPYFTGLKAEPLKKGKSIIGYRFTWIPQKQIDSIAVVANEKLEQEIEQLKLIMVDYCTKKDMKNLLKYGTVKDISYLFVRMLTVGLPQKLDNLTGYMIARLKLPLEERYIFDVPTKKVKTTLVNKDPNYIDPFEAKILGRQSERRKIREEKIREEKIREEKIREEKILDK